MNKIHIQQSIPVEEDLINSTVKQEIISFARLGKEIKISPKTNCNVNKEGYSLECFTESIEVLIGIGKYTATLIMSKEAWVALQTEEVKIVTTEQFKKKLYHG